MLMTQACATQSLIMKELGDGQNQDQSKNNTTWDNRVQGVWFTCDQGLYCGTEI